MCEEVFGQGLGSVSYAALGILVIGVHRRNRCCGSCGFLASVQVRGLMGLWDEGVNDP